MSAQIRAADDSPGLKAKTSLNKNETTSPTKHGRNQFASPSKTGKTPSKLTAKARRNKSPSKGEGEGKDKKESGLASPTSISMQNTFIIKNADESFDAYYA